MLTLVPRRAFRNGFELMDGDRTVAAFHGSMWRENGELTVGGGTYPFRREGGRRFVLTWPDGSVAATARRASRWNGRWEVAVGSQLYELRRRGWSGRAMELSGRGQVLGTVQTRGWSGRRADVDLPAELPLPVQAFVVAVVATLKRREQVAASAGSSGAAGAAT